MPPNYGQLPDADEEARKKKSAENPLVQYFGGGQAKPVAAPAAAPKTSATNVGTNAAPPMATNVGANVAPSIPAQQQQPTGFTNFSRTMSANRAVSEREAKAHGQRATERADAAGKSLEALRARFGAQSAAGTVGAAQNQFAGQPSEGEGLLGEATRPTLGGGLTSAQMYENADKDYSGPMGLGEVEGVDDTVSSMLAAQQNLDAFHDQTGEDGGIQALIQEKNGRGNAGTSGLSASLIGAAGRKDFDALRARFNPQDEFDKADTEAMAAAKAAGETSSTNAAGWRALGDKTAEAEAGEAARQEGEAGRKAADAAAKKAADNARIPPEEQLQNLDWGLDKSDPIAVAQREKEKTDFAAAMQSNFGDEANLAFNEFNKYMSPVNWITEATGTRDPTQDYLTKAIHPHGGDASGSTSGVKIQWTPKDFWVYRQMDPKQWAELNRMTPTNQRGWIQGRRLELAKRGPWAKGGERYKEPEQQTAKGRS